jgi:hypothetical protein
LDAADDILRDFCKRSLPHRLARQMAITAAGAVLGAGTILGWRKTDTAVRVSRLTSHARSPSWRTGYEGEFA